MYSLRGKGKAKRGGRAGKRQQQDSRLLRTPPTPNIRSDDQPKTAGKGRLIVGIDLGTTRSAIAFAVVFGHTSQIDVKIEDFSPSAYSKPEKCPSTQLYYSENSRLPITGEQVNKTMEASATRRGFNPDRLFRLWKLMFHNHLNDPSIKEIQEGIQRQLDALGKTPYDLLHDWVEVKYEEIFQGIRLNDDRFDKLDIEIVVAVPPGRSTVVHDKVRQCFIQGGIKSNAVSLASEPASMFCSWVHESTKKQDWKIGQTYLVADGGGGTCCIVRFRLDRLEPLGFTQEYESESIICGAETISSSFVKLAASKIPPNHPNRSWQLETMRREFDKFHKEYFGRSDASECTFDDKNEDTFYEFSRAEIAACFNPCVDKLIEGAKRQMAKGDRPADIIVLGGGLFASPYVRKIVEKTFHPVRILMPSSDKAHVAKGAVRDRSLGDFVMSCPFTRCKAIATWIEVTQEIKNLSFFKKLFIQNSDRYKKDYVYVAEFIAKKGDSGDSLIGEKSSETLPKDARVRYIDGESDLDFKDIIMTFDYEAGAEDKWVVCCKDNTWVDPRGMPVPDPEKPSDSIPWNIVRDGQFKGSIEDLDMARVGGKPYRVLKYTIQMKFNEMETSYWIKVWSSKIIKKKTGNAIAFVSYPLRRQALLEPHEISRSLAESFKLEDDKGYEHRGHEGTPVGPVRRHDKSSNKAQVDFMNNSRPQVAEASTKTVRFIVNNFDRLVSSLPAPPTEQSLGASLDDESAWQPPRSKRRKIQRTPEANMVSLAGIAEEALGD